MQLDYRCFIRVNDPTVLSTAMKEVEIEARDGKVYSLDMIAEVFSDTKRLMQLAQETIGDIFDTVSVDEDIGFCFIHDQRKTFRFFDSLTEYLYETFIDSIGDEFVLVADVTNYDDDSFGNRIFYYLGDGDSVKTLEIKGPDGLEMHAEKEVSELLHILKDYNLSKSEKASADKYYIKLDDLKAYNFLHSGKKTQKPKKGKQPEKKSKEMESRSKKASDEMLRIVSEAKERAKRAEYDYDAGADRVQRMARSNINIFGSDAASRVADIAKLSRKICDELYAAYQSLVESVDDQCRPLLEERPELDAVEAVYDLIKWLNDESEIENNFSASLNSHSLGGIASGRYIPQMKNKMAEQFWASKYDAWPGRAEKEAAEKKEKKEAEERAKKKEELWIKETEEKYEKKLAEWKMKADAAELRQREQVEERLTAAKEERVKEIEEQYTDAIKALVAEKAACELKKAEAEAKLASLGIFNFTERNEVKKVIAEMTEKIADASVQITAAEEKYKEDTATLDKWLRYKEKELQKEAKKDHPISQRPRKPYFAPRKNGQQLTPAQKADEAIKRDILGELSPKKRYTLSKLMDSVSALRDFPQKRASSLILQLVDEGWLMCTNEDSQTYYRLTEW